SPQRGDIYNLIGPCSIKFFRGELRTDVGILDGKPSIVIDYSSTIARGRPVRDEIRQVGPGLYLGRGFNGSSPNVFFALSERPFTAAGEYYEGKVAIVTGGASGFGRCLCEELARRGATVVVADQNESQAAEVTKAIREQGGNATAEKVDVSSFESVEQAVAAAVVQYGRLDFFFNNAGIAIGGEYRDINRSEHERLMNICLGGVINGVHAAVPRMIEQGEGHIVNTASISGLIPTPLSSIYAAAKHAIVGLSTSLRPEVADLGIKVSVLCPSAMKTPFFEHTPTVNYDIDKLNNSIVWRYKADPARCASKALDAVARNRAIIIVGLTSAWISWWAYRTSPRLMDTLGHHLVRHLRRMRVEPQ
ncbi:MAG: SDR family NAD(P)-dependent oxidoreductase, partial [Deltaproteobacteria bacterium]